MRPKPPDVECRCPRPMYDLAYVGCTFQLNSHGLSPSTARSGGGVTLRLFTDRLPSYRRCQAPNRNQHGTKVARRWRSWSQAHSAALLPAFEARVRDLHPEHPRPDLV